MAVQPSTAPTSTNSPIMATNGDTGGFYDDLSAHHVEPLWTAMKAMVTPQPSPKAQVALWKYEELRPLLLQAGRVVTSEKAERRVLMLTNPALSRYIFTSLLCSLHLVKKTGMIEERNLQPANH